MRRFITSAFVIGIVCGGIIAALASRRVAYAAPVKPSEGLYINYSHHDTIDVIDFVTNKIVRTIQGIPGMHGMSFSPDGRWLYVGSDTEKMLIVVDLVTGKTIKTVPLRGPAHSTLAISKDGKRVFIGIWNSWSVKRPFAPPSGGSLEVFDTTKLEIVKSIPTKSALHDIELTPDGKYVVAGSPEANSITVVDVQTGQVAWEVSLDGGILTMAVEAGPDGSTRRIFATNSSFNGFDVVDFAKRQVVGKIMLPETDTFKAYPQSHEEGDSPSHGLGIAPDKKTLWANSRWGDAVFVYSLPDLKLLGHVDVGKLPVWIAFSPDNKKVYDGNSKGQSLSVIDAKTLKEVTRIPLESNPGRFFADGALP